MKWVIAAILLAASSFAGYRLGYKYTVRDKLFSDLILFVDYFLAQMSFKGNTVRKIIADFSGGKYVKEIFTQFTEQLASAGEIKIKYEYLSVDELNSLNNFLYELGRSDAAAQSATLKGYRDIFAERQKTCCEEKKKYGGLYLKLGILLGALLAILVI